MQALKSKINHFYKYWLPVFVWAVMIFWFSNQPALPGPRDYWVNFAFKKSLHTIEYGIFTWLLFRARFAGDFQKSDFGKSNLRSRTSLVFATAVAILYAASDEIHQTFVPGREATVRDFLFDSVGIFLAAWLIKQKSPKR